MIDKFLIFLLVITLPLGLFAAYRIQKQAAGKQMDEQRATQIDEALNQIEQALERPAQPSQPKISISSVNYASDSGKLEVTGIAPQPEAQIIVSAVVTSSSKSEGNDKVLGERVDVVAVAPQPDGTFVFKYPIEDESSQAIELKFEQNGAISSIKYDLVKNKMVWEKD